MTTIIDPFDLGSAPEGEPPHLVIGQTAQWRRDVPINADLHTLEYRLRSSDGGAYAADTIAMQYISGTCWGVDMAADAINTVVAGSYFWDLMVIRTADSAERVIDTSMVDVYSTDDDRRSHAQTMLEKIESLLEGRADTTVEQYSIKSRSLTRMSVQELLHWRDYYRREVARGSPATTGFEKPVTKSNTLRVRFSS